MKYTRILLLTISFLFPSFLIAQSLEHSFEDLSENIENEEGVLNVEILMNELADLKEHPIQINYATKEELSKLFFLDNEQIEEILNHRKKYGFYNSIYELQQLSSFDLQVLRRIRPYLAFEQKVSLQKVNVKEQGNHYVVARAGIVFPKAKGYESNSETDAKYIGSPWKWQTRFRSQVSEKYKLHLLFEKDAGEKGFDFASGGVQLDRIGAFKNVTFGNYQLRFGQGLVMGGGFRLSPSADPIQAIFPNDQKIYPFTSALEYNYLSGVTSNFKWKGVEFIPFVSIRKLDAVEYDLGFRISDNGLHRTEGELDKKDKLTERIFGVHFEKGFVEDKLTLGGTYLYQSFSDSLVVAKDFSDTKDFSGINNHLGSVDLKGNYQSMSLKAEVAYSSSNAWAFSGSLIHSFSRSFQLGVLHRDYSPSFHSFYGGSLSKNSSIQNEQGTYTTLFWRPRKHLEGFLYFDLYKFPWLKKYDLQTENGSDFFLKVNWEVQTNHLLQFRLSYQEFNEYLSEVSSLVFRERLYIRLNYRNESRENLILNSHLAGKWQSQQENIYGVLLAQDVRYKWRKFQFDLRLAYYNSEAYDVRFYLWEPSMLYQYSFENYYGNGFRTALVVCYKFNKKFRCWLKYANTNFFDRTEIGTGNELREGSNKHSFDFQVMYKL
ncbi:ComEA family DNA-binding protein [Sediminitomix flava]|uniref:Helix-hairpin-helix protein n=1 Tax=Sediminitomix flava TaxID=379075 RepID=A0A315ZBV5_SEDFL|nr:helix-hairpin-helix domain-containing protein [Sediminitomix flava]PWJ42563.1 helix-hairpin-helix protein [Sediminitomix flava]